jgi:DNA-directed RNA polymerase I, II, and III subunit RPABC2
MSDIEEYFSDASDNEDIESSDDDDEKIQIIKKSNDKNNIEDIILNSDDDEDEDEEDEDEEIKIKDQNDDYYDEDDDQEGGGDSSDNESEDDNEENDDTSSSLITPAASKPKKTKITIDPVLDDDEIDDDDDDDENYLQKFDNEISKNYISEQHPECAIHNYDEIAKLSIIVRDNDGIIVDPLHQTLPFMTKYEKARVLGQRTKQIECGANPLIKVPEGIIDAHIIAELELQQQKIPFIIRRPLPGGGSEYWNLKDLENILF